MKTINHWKYTICGIVITILFAGCIPFEGNLDEVREKADGGGTRYTITFESDGGSTIKDQKVKEGGTVKKPQDPTKSGWFFVNWFSDQTLETKYNFNAPVTADITLYADWVVTGTERYKVEFNSKGGSYVEPQFVYEGRRAYPPDDPALRGYDFDAWCTTDGTPPTNAYNFSELITGNKTLYATWDKVTTVPGANLAEKFAWLSNNALSDTEYIVQANSAEPPLAPQTLSYSGYTPVTIRLRGGYTAIPITYYSVSLSGNGSMFTIGSGVTLILENYLILKGHSSNNAALVRVNAGGVLTMRNSTTTITGNTGSGSGGGVYVIGLFNMEDGTISGNSAGVPAPGNVFSSEGGGVYVGANTDQSGEFKMRGGTISGNTAWNYGGGVYVNAIASGVFSASGKFTKIGGTIYGNTGDSNANVVMNRYGTAIVDERGHAVYVAGTGAFGSHYKWKDSTAMQFGGDLDSSTDDNWDFP